MISVIIPCFNSEEYITRAIESIFSQSYTNYEIILVNNNSTDNTYNILQQYQKKKAGLIKVFNEYKKGAPAARNKGLSEAKGEWIQFLDADDELLPGKLEDQISVAKNSKADIIAGSCYMFKTNNGKTEKRIRPIETNSVWKGLILSKLGITSANLWRKQAISAVGGWNEERSSSQEYNLVFKMLKKNDNVSFCLTPLTIVHVREDSVHKSGDSKRFTEILDNNVKLRLEIREYLRSKGMLTKQLGYAADTYIYSYLVNTTGVFSLSLKKGLVAAHVKKLLKESNLKLPMGFIISFHFNRLLSKIKKRL